MNSTTKDASPVVYVLANDGQPGFITWEPDDKPDRYLTVFPTRQIAEHYIRAEELRDVTPVRMRCAAINELICSKSAREFGITGLAMLDPTGTTRLLYEPPRNTIGRCELN